jgi:transcriptional regulator with XRE-family HTH domain
MELTGLRQVCKAQGLSYQQLADKSGVSVHHIRCLAKCTHNSTPSTVAKLAIALNVSPEHLIKPPSVNDLLTQLVGEIRKYNDFSREIYDEYGILLKKIAE